MHVGAGLYSWSMECFSHRNLLFFSSFFFVLSFVVFLLLANLLLWLSFRYLYIEYIEYIRIYSYININLVIGKYVCIVKDISYIIRYNWSIFDSFKFSSSFSSSFNFSCSCHPSRMLDMVNWVPSIWCPLSGKSTVSEKPDFCIILQRIQERNQTAISQKKKKKITSS